VNLLPLFLFYLTVAYGLQLCGKSDPILPLPIHFSTNLRPFVRVGGGKGIDRNRFKCWYNRQVLQILDFKLVYGICVDSSVE